jgi:hypothetical protein
MTCACEKLTCNNDQDLLQQFKACWSACPALNLLLIPDWLEFEELDRFLVESGSNHRSMPLLAFERGYLPRLTGVIHKYLMDGAAVKNSVSRDYRSELRERWQRCDDPLERHRRARGYLGKPIELFVAQDLENSSIAIVGLEATGYDSDIVGSRNGEILFAEVKFIGTDDATFSAIESDLTTGGVSVLFRDPDATHDYLISRLFEAAKQLEARDGIRMAAAVIDNYTSWPIFKFVLEHGFFDWNAPRFISSNAIMKDHLDKLRLKYPSLDEEIGHLLKIVSEVRIYRLLDGYELELHSVIGKDTMST